MATGPAAAADLARRLLDGLVAELAATVAGPVCRVHLSPGAIVTADHCCECAGGQGQASVRLAQLYPSDPFPAPLVDLSRCWAMTWAAQYELVVYRCSGVVDDDGEPPSAERVEHDAQVVMSDAAAMVRAIGCCFAGGPCGNGVVPGAWTPISPNGGCMGGAMTVTVDLDAR